MPSSVLLRRLGYRIAYRALQLARVLVPFPRRGVKCVLTDGERVLLVRHTYGRRDWDLPGGQMRRDEQPLSTARREMAEELGITDAAWAALGEFRGRGRSAPDVLHCFHAEVKAPTLRLDPGEIAEASWFERERLPADLGKWVQPVLARMPATGV